MTVVGNLEDTVRKRRILIVEDDVATAQVYRWRLEKEGFEVKTVADGSDAFFTANSEPFDLILLDIMLPQMDGLSILKRLRAQKRFQALPIAIFTNANLQLVVPEARRAGANCVFQKAATPPTKIVEGIKELLANSDSSAMSELVFSGKPEEPALGEASAGFYAGGASAEGHFSTSERVQSPDFRVPASSPDPPLKLQLAGATSEPEPEPEPPSAPAAAEDKAGIMGTITSFFRRQKQADSPAGQG